MSPSGSLSHPVSPPSPRLGRSPSESPDRASARGRIHTALGACSLRSPEVSLRSGLLPAASSAASAHFTWEPRIRPLAGAGLGRPAGVLRPEPPREVANCCQHVERDAPLQTAARTGVVFSLLSVPCPPAARVSACVPPMPKSGSVYHCTNSSSDLPPTLEGAPRWRASGSAVRAGLWVSGKLQGGLG